MNTLLEKLFEQHNLSEKDSFDIRQIFSLLPDGKKQNLLNNFGILASRIEQIHKWIALERRILIWNLNKDIESFYIKYSDQL